MAGIHFLHHQRHLQAGTKNLAMPLKIITCSLQAMVYMDGRHLPWPLARASQQQRGGIGTAAVAYGQRQGWLERGHGLFQA
jgi:hypothetical protein